MQFEIPEEERKKAKIPHDLFLVNLIGNHILIFVGTLGLASTWVWPMLAVPLISLSILGSIIVLSHKSKSNNASWFEMCHWQIAVKRSWFFIKMILTLTAIGLIGIYGYTNLGWMKEAVYALIGGVCLLPVMVTTLILILMESDALHSADQGKVPDNLLEKFPAPANVKVITEE